MQILTSHVEPASAAGPEVQLLVADLDPQYPDGLLVRIPLMALPDRRAREQIAACADQHDACTCAVCDCCTAALEVILAEHFARLNPDQLHRLPADLAGRLVDLGGVPGKVRCPDHGIEDAGAHATEPSPLALRATGAHVTTAGPTTA